MAVVAEAKTEIVDVAAAPKLVGEAANKEDEAGDKLDITELTKLAPTVVVARGISEVASVIVRATELTTAEMDAFTAAILSIL